jgi:hypothetical protein
VHGHQLAPLALTGEVVHVHLIGAEQREQLAGERAQDRVGLLGGAVGEPHQSAQAAEQRVVGRQRSDGSYRGGDASGHGEDSRESTSGGVLFL